MTKATTQDYPKGKYSKVQPHQNNSESPTDVKTSVPKKGIEKRSSVQKENTISAMPMRTTSHKFFIMQIFFQTGQATGERFSFCLSLHLSVSVPICLSVCLSFSSLYIEVISVKRSTGN